MADQEAAAMLDAVAGYYEDKLSRHGATARGMDWNSEDSQRLRFEQLCRLLPAAGAFSLNDVGCGGGELRAFLHGAGAQVDYLGVDISPAMIEAAHARAGALPCTRFIAGTAPDRTADYSVASGIFNVRLQVPDTQWREHLLSTLEAMNDCSRRGFAFNCLTSYSDPERMQPHLYYADPLALFDLCKRRYARDVALLHDYGLYEFTMIVRKES